jgi:hypothetical protein
MDTPPLGSGHPPAVYRFLNKPLRWTVFNLRGFAAGRENAIGQANFLLRSAECSTLLEFIPAATYRLV